MPNAVDRYSVELRETHLKWGTTRNTNSREAIIGEGYIPIPRKYAKMYNIYNSNSDKSNLYNASSNDGHFSGILKAQGSMKKGDVYAKNFSKKGDLKAIGVGIKK